MTKRGKWLRLAALTMMYGAALPGCLAAVQTAADQLLSPGAFGNALVIPFTGVAALAIFASQLLY